MADKQDTQKKLQEHLRHILEYYYGGQIIGIFSPVTERYENVASVVLTIPTFEEMCLLKEPKLEKFCLEDDIILVKDIRLFSKELEEFAEKAPGTNHSVLMSDYAESFIKLFLEHQELGGGKSKEVLVDMIKTAALDWEEQRNVKTKEEIYDYLTKAEIKALETIAQEIGREGYILISKMIDKYGISRSIYKNLFAKLKEHQVAEITSHGVKGIEVNVTHRQIAADMHKKKKEEE